MTPDEVLEDIERMAPVQGLLIIGPKRGEILDEMVETQEPATILEVGTLVGYSAVRMGEAPEKGSEDKTRRTERGNGADCALQRQ